MIHLAKQYEPKGSKGFGMSKLVPRYLKMQVDKTNQLADWTLMSKSPELKRYAALDAYLHLKLFSVLTKLISDENAHITEYTPDARVQLMYRKKVIAIGTLEFVGGTGGEVRKWGRTTVGKNTSLVRVEKVTVASAKPHF